MSEWICVQCQSKGNAVKRKRGYAAVSWVLIGIFGLSVAAQFYDASIEVPQSRGNYKTPELFLWFTRVSFLAWLTHVIFRAVSAKQVCPTCSAVGAMVPADSPRGHQLLGGVKQ